MTTAHGRSSAMEWWEPAGGEVGYDPYFIKKLVIVELQAT
uniref:Uncharacterized protein n=1 Tax=Oryza brachyantha TaxID=4533 RepID=J3MK16_ORYBR